MNHPDVVGDGLLAQAFYDEGRFEEAVCVSEQRLKEDPEDEQVQLILTRALVQLGRHEEASRWRERFAHAQAPSGRLRTQRADDPGDPSPDGEQKRHRQEPPKQEPHRQEPHRQEPHRQEPPKQEPHRQERHRQELQELALEWETALEDQSGQLPDPIADLREPSRHTPSIELPLPPLASPLAQGMPPLPLDERWRMASRHTEHASTLRAVGEAPSGSEKVAESRGEAVKQPVSRDGVDQALVPFKLSFSGEVPSWDPYGQRGGTAEILRGAATASHIPMTAAPTSRRAPRRIRRHRLWLLGGGIGLLVFAGVTTWYVVGGRVVDKALVRARAAWLSADSRELFGAEALLTDARRYWRNTRRLDDELALLRELRGLLYGEGAGAEIRSPSVLRGRPLNEKGPNPQSQGEQSQGLHAVLRAWRAWLDGHSAAALQLLKNLHPRAGHGALVPLIRSYIHLERGELDVAERTAKQVLEQRPGLLLGQLVLASIWLERGEARAEVERIANDPGGGSPVEAAWQAALRLELTRTAKTSTESLALTAAWVITSLTHGRSPASCSVVAQLSRTLGRACEFEAAEGLLKRALGAKGRSTGLRGELALHRGQDSEAVRWLQLTEPTPRVQQRLREARFYMRQMERTRDDERSSSDPELAAAAALARDDAALAIRLASSLGERPGRQPRAHWILAQALVQQGREDEALRETQRALKGCSGFAGAHALAGQLYLEQNDFARAEGALRAARAAGLNAVVLEHARALAELGDRQAATALVQQAQRMGAGGDELQLAQAELALARGEPGRCLSQLSELKADSWAGRVLRIRALTALNQLAEAELTLLSSLRQRPNHPLLELLRGELLLQQNSSEAREHLQHVVALTEGRDLHAHTLARAHLALAKAMARPGGKPSAASFSHAELATRADERFAAGFVELGRFHLFEDQLKAARLVLERATSLEPQNATALYLLAVAQRDDRNAQSQTYRRFLQLEPEGWRAKRAREALSQTHP